MFAKGRARPRGFALLYFVDRKSTDKNANIPNDRPDALLMKVRVYRRIPAAVRFFVLAILIRSRQHSALPYETSFLLFLAIINA